jgi:BCCT family betaine/carnitine transporter
MSSEHGTHYTPALDKGIFWPSLIIFLVFVLPLSIWPDESLARVNAMLAVITFQLGWLYLSTGVAVFGLMLWLAFGRFGHVKLGQVGEEPEFSKPTWLTMLFCAGIGVSIVNWAFVEPIYFLQTPPFNIEKGSAQAVEYAIMYPQFHWGVIPWALYIFPAIPVAYAHYVRKEPFIRLSTACGGAIGRHKAGVLGKAIDAIVMLAILGGIGTSLGLGVPLVSGLFADLLGIRVNFFLYAVVLFIWAVMFGLSVWRGLQKGMRIISNINVAIALVMLALFLACGPTLFMVRLWSNSLGLLLDNFWRMSLWTDPIVKSGFPESWTVFYWGWWFALLPMMGLFVARISKGRTIREVVLYGVLFGSLGCWVYFAIWGGYAVDLEINRGQDLTGMLAAQGIPATVLFILHTMPFSKIVIILFSLLCFFFLATTLDAAAYALAANCTRDLPPDKDPARWNRMFWAGMLVLLAVGLLLVGGLQAVQISSVIVAVPMLPVVYLLGKSLLGWLNQDFAHLNPPREHIPEKALELPLKDDARPQIRRTA